MLQYSALLFVGVALITGVIAYRVMRGQQAGTAVITDATSSAPTV